MTPTENVISRFKSLHGDLYDYSNVNYVDSKIKVEIVCLKHGSFFKTVESHCKGRGCPVCSQSNTRYTMESLLSKFESIHSDTYDYSKVVFKNVRSKVTIICKQHGEFEQRADQHIQGMGCLTCSIQNKIGNQISYLDHKSYKYPEVNTVSLIAEFQQVHGDLYDYSDTVYVNFKTKVAIKCRKHGVFMQRTRCHASGKGCPICRSSKGESRIREFLKLNNIDFVEQYKICKNPKTGSYLRADFYLPTFNTCIEYDGRQHFEPTKFFGGENGFDELQYRDEYKNNYCQENDIKLIRISYKEYAKIHNILSVFNSEVVYE